MSAGSGLAGRVLPLLFLNGPAGSIGAEGRGTGQPAWAWASLGCGPQDSPSNKLLYAKEISTYKKMVEE